MKKLNDILFAGSVVTASGVSFADPYVSGRAPEFNFYNLGLERGITRDMTIAVNYVGNQSHFLINSTNSGNGSARGYWVNQLNPNYLLALGPAVGIPASGSTLASAAIPLLNRSEEHTSELQSLRHLVCR